MKKNNDRLIKYLKAHLKDELIHYVGNVIYLRNSLVEKLNPKFTDMIKRAGFVIQTEL